MIMNSKSENYIICLIFIPIYKSVHIYKFKKWFKKDFI